MIEKSQWVSDRRDFGAFANLHKVRVAVEVGVDQGIFARDFLRQWRGERLYLVDTWEAMGNMSWEREMDRLCALNLTCEPTPRVRFIRRKSAEAPQCIRGQDEVRFVYIDAAHDYKNVMQDIETWWQVLRSGGILAGHDFHKDGVKTAVKEFSEKHGLTTYYTHDKWPSWHTFKPT